MCVASWSDDTRLSFVFFFFKAVDGIRDYDVTGVQTCALPIYGDDFSGTYVITQPVLHSRVSN